MHDFERRLAADFPPADWSDVGVVVACSGGADSVALLRSLSTIRSEGGGPLIVAHFNHRLRGAESDGDEAFVVELAGQVHAPCIVGRGEVATAAAEQGDGIEAAARTARYRFLEQTAVEQGARYVVTAHTRDDQAETVLHRILRGTGISGLAGIPRSRSLAGGAIGLVRPMLNTRRADVLEYLAALGQPHRDDSSNASLDYTRNRLRHELLPQLARHYNPRIVEALTRLATQADAWREVIDDLVEPLVAKSLRRADATSCEIDCAPLAQAPLCLVQAAMIAAWKRCGWPQQAMGYDEWESLATMAVDGPSTPIMLPGSIRAQRSGTVLVLTRAGRNDGLSATGG